MKPFTYHTHSTYCDGKDPLRDIAGAALSLGLDSLGLSCHSYLVDDFGCISPERVEEFKSEVRAIEAEYRPRGLDIFLGIEQDLCSLPIEKASDYDYIIGSVHNLTVNGERVTIDMKQCFRDNLEKHFAGDAVALAVEYFKAVSGIYEATGCNIVGHLDLISKFNEGNCLFDERDARYERAAGTAIEELVSRGLIFEINTGAMARNYRSEPYPSRRLLSMIREAGGSVTFASDCHNVEFLIYGFDEVCKMAKECGFNSLMKLKRVGNTCSFYPEEI